MDLAGKKTTLSTEYATATASPGRPTAGDLVHRGRGRRKPGALWRPSLSGKTAFWLGSGDLRPPRHRPRRTRPDRRRHEPGRRRGPGRGSARDRSRPGSTGASERQHPPTGAPSVFHEDRGGRRTRLLRRHRNLDGSPAVRLGEGNGQSISSDGKRVLALVGPAQSPDFVIYPTGAGEAKRIPVPGLTIRGCVGCPTAGVSSPWRGCPAIRHGPISSTRRGERLRAP